MPRAECRMKEKTANPVEDKSFRFAVRTVKFSRYLTEEKKEHVLSNQLLRSGTSIGANVSEGVRAQSKPDFVHKMSVALKEAGETAYWLRLLHETGYLTDAQFESVYSDANELIALLVSICKSASSNL